MRRRRGLNARREHGATAAEYALLVSAVALVIVAGVFFFGNSLSSKLGSSGSCIQNVGGAVSTC